MDKNLEIIEKRKSLSEDEVRQLKRATIGVHGEKKFYEILGVEKNDAWRVIEDYRFIVDGSECQIDYLIFYNDTAVIIEVKNYYGDYELRGDDLYRLNPVQQVSNPVSQLKRAELLFKNHLAKLDISMDVRSFIVFINEEFALYHARRDLKIVMPGQIKRFLKSLSRETFSDASSSKIETILENRLLKSRHDIIVGLKYEDMKRGVTCSSCTGWMKVKNQRNMVCPLCGTEETNDSAFKRSIQEFNVLFPDGKVSVSLMVDWTAGIFSKDKVRTMLNRLCTKHGQSRGTHYKLKK